MRNRSGGRTEAPERLTYSRKCYKQPWVCGVTAATKCHHEERQSVSSNCYRTKVVSICTFWCATTRSLGEEPIKTLSCSPLSLSPTWVHGFRCGRPAEAWRRQVRSKYATLCSEGPSHKAPVRLGGSPASSASRGTFRGRFARPALDQRRSTHPIFPHFRPSSEICKNNMLCCPFPNNRKVDSYELHARFCQKMTID